MVTHGPKNDGAGSSASVAYSGSLPWHNHHNRKCVTSSPDQENHSIKTAHASLPKALKIHVQANLYRTLPNGDTENKLYSNISTSQYCSVCMRSGKTHPCGAGTVTTDSGVGGECIYARFVRTPPATIGELPLELLPLILQWLPHTQAVKVCSLVCKKWYAASKV